MDNQCMTRLASLEPTVIWLVAAVQAGAEATQSTVLFWVAGGVATGLAIIRAFDAWRHRTTVELEVSRPDRLEP